MFSNWIKNIVKPDVAEAGQAMDMRQVSVQLLLEVARSDSSIDDVERDFIIGALLKKSHIEPNSFVEYLDNSEQEVDKSISFHEHIRLINNEFSQEHKVNLIEQMWQVAYADGELNEFEEAFIRQVSDLIHVKHRDFMRTKHRVMAQQAGD